MPAGGIKQFFIYTRIYTSHNLVCIHAYYSFKPGGIMKSTNQIKEMNTAGYELKRHNGGNHQMKPHTTN